LSFINHPILLNRFGILDFVLAEYLQTSVLSFNAAQARRLALLRQSPNPKIQNQNILDTSTCTWGLRRSPVMLTGTETLLLLSSREMAAPSNGLAFLTCAVASGDSKTVAA
jgi:hypothetical protein